MTNGETRRWLAVYFLLVTTLIGAFLLILPGTSILPLRPEEATSSFQILIPVLVGQITVIFRWLSGADSQTADLMRSPVPGWAIKLPPALALLVLIAAIVALAVANRPEVNSSMSPTAFKSAITFAVTILNASTVILVPRFFPPKPHK